MYEVSYNKIFDPVRYSIDVDFGKEDRVSRASSKRTLLCSAIYAFNSSGALDKIQVSYVTAKNNHALGRSERGRCRK